jgi:hypothetical protein
MFMTAFETFAAIAEQQRAGRQQRFALRRPAAKCSRGHDRNAGGVVLFLEWAIVRARGAHEVIDLPARPGREKL